MAESYVEHILDGQSDSNDAAQLSVSHADQLVVYGRRVCQFKDWIVYAC